MHHNTWRFAIQYFPLNLILGISLIGLTHRLRKYHSLFSNVDIRQPLLVLIILLELHGYIFFGDTPVIVVAGVCDTETQIIEYNNTKYGSN